MANLYVISGCNGAGKTTASYSVLPDMLNCKEFVNADEIAKGLSPFQPDKVAIEAGRIMLTRIKDLIKHNVDFAFETTLASKSYAPFIREAQLKGYFVTLVFFWLNSPELAIERVKTRVNSGGHDIPENVINRRYWAGISNLSKLYVPISDYWLIIDNSEPPFQVIAEGFKNDVTEIKNQFIYNQIVKHDKR
jgi:predicted ABC-type ATPase